MTRIDVYRMLQLFCSMQRLISRGRIFDESLLMQREHAFRTFHGIHLSKMSNINFPNPVHFNSTLTLRRIYYFVNMKSPDKRSQTFWSITIIAVSKHFHERVIIMHAATIRESFAKRKRDPRYVDESIRLVLAFDTLPFLRARDRRARTSVRTMLVQRGKPLLIINLRNYHVATWHIEQLVFNWISMHILDFPIPCLDSWYRNIFSPNHLLGFFFFSLFLI